jgi:hypothetical protein
MNRANVEKLPHRIAEPAAAARGNDASRFNALTI